MPIDAPPIVWRTDQPTPHPSARSFLPLLRAAVASHPDRPDLLLDLAVALRDDQRWAEICDLLSPLAESGSLSAALTGELARAAIACDRPEHALAVLDATTAGTTLEVRRQRALALYALSRNEEARMAAAQALNDDPCNRTLLDAYANDCLTRGAAEELATMCERAIQDGVGSTIHLAYLSAALSMAGRAADVLRLIDPEGLCRRIQLNSGLVDNKELARAILAHPSLAPSAEIRPTRGRNLRLDGLAGIQHPAIRNLLETIRREVDVYLAERLNAPHPLLDHRPASAFLQGWALVLAEDGHEDTHIHPHAWLTVVYYVRVPQVRAARDAPSPGALAFGPWPPSIGKSLLDFPRWQIEPQEGTLLIFPAFLGHGTIPTDVTDLRICVALDVLPCDPVPAP